MIFSVFAFAAALVPGALAPGAVRAYDLTEEVKQETIHTLLQNLKRTYVFPEKADQAEQVILGKLKAGEYKSISNGSEFADQLTEDANSILHDVHFRVRFSDKPLPPRQKPTEPSRVEIEAQARQTREANAGFEKVERLTGNIGYLEIRQFFEADDMARPAAAAFNFLQNTSALIIDLRRNPGGSPAAVQLFCSYLFSEKPVHLNSLYFRPSNQTTEYWTLKSVDGPRYLNKPVWILVSKKTGSGAEECSYNLQNLKRATIVGEPTWGGANPGGIVRLNDHFDVFIPVGRAINPITKTNWEGTGVQPDLACAPVSALEIAQIEALRHIAKTADENAKPGIQNRIAELEKMLPPSPREIEATLIRISSGY